MTCQLRDELYALWYDLFKMSAEMLLTFLWYLAPVVGDVTLGCHHHFWCSPLSRAVACWETLHRPRRGTRMSFRTCVLPGGWDSASYQTVSPAISLHRKIAVVPIYMLSPETKIILPKDEVKTAKALVLSNYESLQISAVGHVTTIQETDNERCLQHGNRNTKCVCVDKTT